jgi:hypothetical protein
MHQQVVLVDESPGDETAGEAGAAVRNDRLAVLGLQLRDFLRQVAARHIGLRPAFSAGLQRLIDGPFAETRELVAGFWLWEVKDMDEAVAWLKRCPNPMPGPREIEIRPLYEMADLRRE